MSDALSSPSSPSSPGLPASARAYVFTAYGGAETQCFANRPVPAPGPGRLLVRVHAAGVDPADWKVRSGARTATVPVDLPAVLGREAAGVVVAIGPSDGSDADATAAFAIGDRVFGSTAPGYGGYAEYTLLDGAATAPIPEGVSFAAAAVIPVALGTAYDIVDELRIVDADTVVVIGAGGGVGLPVTRLARARGARVIGIASAAKRARVESVEGVWAPPDADPASLPTPTVVVDTVGGDALDSFGPAAAPRVIGIADTDRASAVGGGGVTRRRTTAVYRAVAELVRTGALDPGIARIVPFDDAARALAIVESGHAPGKIVLRMR